MTALGLIGIVVGLALLVFFIYKGYSLVIAAPVATMVVVLFNGLPFIDSMFGPERSYMSGLASFILGNFPVFLFGAILAKYMDKSGAALSIAENLMALVGTSSPYRALVSLFVISSVLTLGGINVFVVIFILIPMAKPIFKQYNISWGLVVPPIFGGGATFTMTMVPGSPSLHNVVPSNALGTPLTAAPLVGIVTTVAAIAFLLIYMKVALNRSLKRNEVFEAEMEGTGASDIFARARPSFAVSILPIATLLTLILALSFVKQVIIYALLVAIVMSAVLFRRHLKQKEVINQGTGDSLTSVLATGSTIAFGSFAVGVPAFSSVFDGILSIPGNPYISLSVGVMVLAGITASSVGAEGIAVKSFAPTYLDMGLNPETVHRAIAISGGTSLLPHNGFLAVFNGLAGFTLKDSFIRGFISFHVPHYIGIVILVIMASTGLA
ncbi:GntP family permease [Pseudarthrobacter sp. YS3]|uniref:GntP family permease n=1 Tax=Pseudarthrobacter sp. YS3 TaxID=3453718 RepID=UPI003EEADEAF